MRRKSMVGLRPRGYAVAVACVALGLFARLALGRIVGPTALPFITFFPVVAAAAWYGGLKPGFLALALSTLVANWFFIPPLYTLSIAQGYDLAATLAFLSASGLIVLAVGLAHRRGARLIETHELLSTTLASIGDGVLITDAGGQIRFLNAEAERLTGWTSAEAEGRALTDVFRIVNEDTREPVENPVDRALREGRVVGLANHTVLLSKDGRETPIDDSASPIRGRDGLVLGAVLVFRDATEQRLAFAAHARLAAIVEHSGDAVFTKDLEGVIQTWNQGAERLFGYRENEIVGKSIMVLIPPELQLQEAEILGSLQKGGSVERLETVRVAKDGTRIPVLLSVSPLKDKDGRVVGASKIVHDISERVAAREALHREKELLATTLASIGDAVIVTDPEGRITFLNGEAERLTRWKSGEARGRPLPEVFHIVHEETRQPVENPVEKVLRHGSVVGLANHTVLIAKDGSEHAIDDSAAPIRKTGGELAGVVLVFRDITARREAERNAARAAERFRSVVDHVVDGIISIDERGVIRSFNPAAERIFGYPKEEVIGRNVSVLMPSPYRDEHDRYLTNYLSTNTPKVIGIGREVEGRRKDGSTFPMDLGVSEYMDGTERRFTGIVRDITDRKRSEAVLRESEQHFRLLADAAPVLIWMSGADRLRTWFNKGWLDFVGRSMEQEIGNGWAENVHPEDMDRCVRTYVTSFDAREPFSMTYRLRRHDGEFRWILDHGVLRHDSGGAFAGYIGSCVDVTESVRAEAARRDADRRKDEFLAILSHELRNPLAPIRMAVGMLRQMGPPDPELVELRDIIDRQTTQLARLLDDLLDVSRIASGKIVLRKEPISLGLAIASAVESTRPAIRSRKHDLDVVVPEEQVHLEGDLARLAQVFTNLLHNASKYTPENGRITVTLQREGSDAVVRVRDTGVGLAPDQLTRVFDMFAQVDESPERAQGGLGVGLALSRRLVEMHGGRIRAHSDGIGKGSEFSVRLPILTGVAHPRDPVALEAAAPVSGSGYRILVADDNVDSTEVLAWALRRAGHETRVALDGAAAVATATQFQPHMALLDIGMPRMNGYEVARELRSLLGARVVLVAITGWGQEEDRRHAKEAGFDHHLTKPVDLAILQRLISSVGVPARDGSG